MWEPKKNLFEIRNGELPLFSRVKKIVSELSAAKRVVTSLEYPSLKNELGVKDMPTGFHQTQLPLSVENCTAIFLTTANADAYFPEHMHSNASVFRVIVSGTINIDGKELSVGDWMFVPAGVPYWIKAGSSGATIVHAYGPPD